jgi:hypothetical protein
VSRLLVYLTVMVRGAEWLIEPEMPVTITVIGDEAAVCFELVAPHPRANSVTTRNKPRTLAKGC